MNILFTLHDDFNPDAGGTGVTLGLGEAYRELGHDVTYFAFDRLPRRMPFRLKFLLFPEYVAYYVERLMRHRRVDVIDASSGDAWLWASLRRSRPNVPLLVTRSHGLEHVAHAARRHEARNGQLHLSWKYPIYWGGYRLWEAAVSFRRADLALFLNHADRDHALAHLGLPEERARVVDNGIPSFLLGRVLEQDETAQPPAVAHIGSYLPMKGTRYLAAAMGAVLARRPSLRFTLLGTGCAQERVYADYDPVLHSRISVVPSYRREHLPALLREHSIVVSATLREGFGLGILESMACGLAPVATSTPGPVQFIRDGENGVLVPPADGVALAFAIDRLLDDRALLSKLQRGAHATAQRYGWKRVARETLALYEEAIRARGDAHALRR